jgi:hypothetical protein
VTVNKERVQLLVDALRSGEFVQGTGGLRQHYSNRPMTYCCLGVATDIALRHGLEVPEIGVGDPSDWSGQPWGQPFQVMCPTVADWYGFKHGNPELVGERGVTSQAATWNDQRHANFATIADMFERTYITNDEAPAS